ncbi:ATP-binding protein [Microcoleus sp. LEGE 07076]|uniref:AAA family ATPase n=1 Tax=Microcoleus sp. LEGE 07076 TaxID=915322 RepID=UPI0018820CDE|nr:AAA family ATPase [Microcoleus sp. LEGE 07076]MBE9185453.1 ATP-binding protein [Microcoleus sp. LEGE 07076]
MKLDSFEYVSNKGLPSEWRVEECRLSQVNLIVGKNASGKSRIVKSIHLLSQLLSDDNIEAHNDEWHLYFDIDRPESKTEYILKIEKGLVVQEKLIMYGEGNEPLLLERDRSGEGTIFAKELNQKIRFQTPKAELAAIRRRDSIQHPFLEKLYQWSNSLRFYEFGTQLGKNFMTLMSYPTIKLSDNKRELKSYNSVVSIFQVGKQQIGDEFIQAIISDMKKIGYNLSEIGTKVPSAIEGEISLDDNIDNLPEFIYVKEESLEFVTEQSEISQGMFRALSLLIQINYSLLTTKPSCIVIDDIGEGLDYQRSSAIIKILIEKAKQGLFQLIMTTNDEFIMNGVPIEYWSVIERNSASVKLHNIYNSHDKIEEFKFIGLNNFDLFTSEFLLEKTSDQA